jgi:His/Glu/Gln/Arg/opine family amino acid ABC transporter permease subunit
VNYKLDFGPVIDGLPNLLWGSAGTLGLALSGMLLATGIGIGGVVLRDSRNRASRWLVIAFVELIRNTPFLVQIYFIFFALPLAGVRLNPTMTRSSHSASMAEPMPLRSSEVAYNRSIRDRSKRASHSVSTRRRCSG